MTNKKVFLCKKILDIGLAKTLPTRYKEALNAAVCGMMIRLIAMHSLPVQDCRRIRNFLISNP